MNRANAVAKMLLIDLLHAGLPQAFNLLKKNKNKKQYLQRIVKCSKSMPVLLLSCLPSLYCLSLCFLHLGALLLGQGLLSKCPQSKGALQKS